MFHIIDYTCSVFMESKLYIFGLSITNFYTFAEKVVSKFVGRSVAKYI